MNRINVIGKATQFWVYMDIFPNVVWYICMGSVLAISLGYTIISLSAVNNFHKPDDSEVFRFSNGVALTILYLLQLGYGVLTNSMSSKIIYLTTGMFSYLIWSYYESDLTARMTSGPTTVAIRGAIRMKYIFLVFSDSSPQFSIKKSSDGWAGFYMKQVKHTYRQ
jgi:hypothetical protein